MNYINIITHETEIPSCIGGRQNITWENSSDFLKELGWRIVVPPPDVASGYTRKSIIPIEGDGTYCAWSILDVPVEDAEAERKARRCASLVEAGLVGTSSWFRSTLNQYFGSGSEVNREITEAYVFNYFTNAPDLAISDVQNGMKLQAAFGKLSAWNGTGETWTLFEDCGSIIP